MIYHVVNIFSTRFKAPMLRSDLCDYSDVYIFVKGRITLRGNNIYNRANKNLFFNNNTQFRSYILKDQ